MNNIGNVNLNYLDGVSITYGPPGSRHHIWSLAIGHVYRCPCDLDDPMNVYLATPPPTEVGENYFCTRVNYTETPVWDGSGCHALNPCCAYNDPPFFQVHLDTMTNERIELRICSDEISSDEMLYINFVELFIFSDEVRYLPQCVL